MIVFKYLVIGGFTAAAKWLYPIFLDNDSIKTLNEVVKSQSKRGNHDIVSLDANMKKLSKKAYSGLVICFVWLVIISFLPALILIMPDSLFFEILAIKVDLGLTIISIVCLLLNIVFFYLECLMKFKDYEVSLSNAKKHKSENR